MTQMFGQLYCLWNDAKNKLDLASYNSFINCADVGKSPYVFMKSFLEGTPTGSHLIFPQMRIFQAAEINSNCKNT